MSLARQSVLQMKAVDEKDLQTSVLWDPISPCGSFIFSSDALLNRQPPLPLVVSIVVGCLPVVCVGFRTVILPNGSFAVACWASEMQKTISRYNNTLTTKDMQKTMSRYNNTLTTKEMQRTISRYNNTLTSKEMQKTISRYNNTLTTKEMQDQQQ